MKRRDFLKAGAAMTLPLGLGSVAFAQDGTVYVYTGADSNVSDFWTNFLIPRFKAAGNAQKITVVDAGDGAGMTAIAQRALAALNGGNDPQVDVFEGYDPLLVDGSIEAGLWVDFSAANLPNYSRVNPAAIDSPYSLPYRGSQVLLAYDADRVDAADAPTTWDALTAWMQANPGQFVYNRPDKGGSGGNFVRRAIHQANGLDPSKFTIDNYSEDYAAQTLPGAWAILNEIAPHLYEGGSYSGGNTQSIQLLAQGVVQMTPVWSDQVLQAISQGVLPENTGLVQLQDLALAGGFSRMTIPTNAANLDAALAIANFVLSEEAQSLVLTELGGFPGVSWDYVSPALREKFAAVIPASIPTFPGGDWSAAVSDGWYRNVAPNLSR